MDKKYRHGVRVLEGESISITSDEACNEHVVVVDYQADWEQMDTQPRHQKVAGYLPIVGLERRAVQSGAQQRRAVIKESVYGTKPGEAPSPAAIDAAVGRVARQLLRHRAPVPLTSDIREAQAARIAPATDRSAGQALALACLGGDLAALAEVVAELRRIAEGVESPAGTAAQALGLVERRMIVIETEEGARGVAAEDIDAREYNLLAVALYAIKIAHFATTQREIGELVEDAGVHLQVRKN